MGWILIQLSFPNIFWWKLSLLERDHQNSQTVLGATGMNELQKLFIFVYIKQVNYYTIFINIKNDIKEL